MVLLWPAWAEWFVAILGQELSSPTCLYSQPAFLWCSMPFVYKVTLNDTTLIIHRQIGKVRIPLNTITKVETKDEIGLDLRLWGISFFFGHYGLFYNRTLGKYRAYVKNSDQMLVVHTSNRIHVFSCERRDELLTLLQQRVS